MRRRERDRNEDRRTALIAWVIAQGNGAQDTELDDFMPKTEAEIREAKAMKALAWFESKVAASKAREEQG